MRTFIAIEIDTIVRERIADLQRELRKTHPRLRWTDPDKIHLTLKFLGNIDEHRLADVRAALDQTSSSTAPFVVGIRRTGVFPPAGAPRVVWAGVEDHDGALTRCRASVEAAMAARGFPAEDRPFSPHLTLARCPDPRAARDLRQSLTDHGPFDAGVMKVHHLFFIQSTLTSHGSIYHPISKHELIG